jgi:hypothetical protein
MCCVGVGRVYFCASASVLFFNCNVFQQLPETKNYKHVSDVISSFRMAKCSSFLLPLSLSFHDKNEHFSCYLEIGYYILAAE